MLFLVYKNESHSFSACFAKKNKKSAKTWKNKIFFLKTYPPQSTSLFAKDQKTAKPLKKKIFLPKSYPPHLSTCSPCFLRPPPSGEPTKQSQGTSKQCRNLEMTKSQIWQFSTALPSQYFQKSPQILKSIQRQGPNNSSPKEDVSFLPKRPSVVISKWRNFHVAKLQNCFAHSVVMEKNIRWRNSHVF